MTKIAIIADDITGANDTGVHFAVHGYQVVVSFNNKPVDCDIPVINTQSRTLSAKQAAMAVTQTVQHLNGYFNHAADKVSSDKAAESLPALLYKKIDSTFRGNIGAELAAAMQAFQCPVALVAAAIPSMSRTCEQGQCLIDGQPVNETEFASDPLTPVKHAAVSEIISEQALFQFHHISLQKLREKSWADALQNPVRQASLAKPLVIIADSVTDEDLQQIASCINQLVSFRQNRRLVVVAASGLAPFLAQLLAATQHASQNVIKQSETSEPHGSNTALPRMNKSRMFCGRPVLTLAGSMSGVTRQQIEFAGRSTINSVQVEVVDMHIDDLISDGRYAAAVSNMVMQILQAGNHCIVRTSQSENQRYQIQVLLDKSGLDRTALAAKVTDALAGIFAGVLERNLASGILLTGGEVAMAVAKSVKAKGYRIAGNITAGLPYGYFTGETVSPDKATQIPLATKAGGFGNAHAIADVIRFFTA